MRHASLLFFGTVKLLTGFTPALLCPLILIGLPFFFIGGPGYHAARSFIAAWDLGHVFFFTIATTWVLMQFRDRLAVIPSTRLFPMIFLGVLVSGTVLELLQMFSGGRDPDPEDVLRNQLGCLTALALCAGPGRYAIPGPWRRLLRVSVVFMLAITAWPFARSVVDEHMATRQFPILADFETPFERYRWDNVRRTSVEISTVRHGQKAMRVQLSTAKYSGIALFHFPENWQGYRTLHCSIFNPLPTVLPLNCRIHDIHHKLHDMAFADRFNMQLKLQQGWNDVVIDLEQVWNAPKNRLMDVQHVEGLGFFVMQMEQPLAIIIDHLFLAH